jgi:hypothetical protein
MQRLARVFLFVLTFVLGGLLEAAPIHADDVKSPDSGRAERREYTLVG